MSILMQPGAYALVYTNPGRVAKESRIYAVIRICFGSDEDSIAVAYAKIGEEQMGYQLPQCSVTVDGRAERISIVSGQLWKDLVKMAETAMKRVKAEFEKVPAGKMFKVCKGADGKAVVQMIGEELE